MTGEGLFLYVHSLFTCIFVISKEEVRDEGKKGLIQPQIDNPFGWDEKSRQFPEFCSMLQYLHKRVSHEEGNLRKPLLVKFCGGKFSPKAKDICNIKDFMQK